MKFLNEKKFLPESLTINEEMVNKLRLARSDLASLLLLDWDIYDLLYTANKIREKYCGNKIKFCSIVNAKSGRCSEDCKFCSQSAHYNTNTPEYGLKEPHEILFFAKNAEKNGSRRFGIVTSGHSLTDEKDWQKIYEIISLLKKETNLIIDASLGCLDLEHAKLLKKTGLTRYHHNLETSLQFFPKICSTHNFSDRLNAVKIVKAAGLELCCGGLFGIGEDWKDRIELASILKEIEPDSVPLNFLNPIPGTPLESAKPLNPLEILRIIAIYRIILPKTDISVCGGRERNLRDLQSWIFYAGANATMLGNYLTTPGRPPKEDLQMIEDLGLCPELS